MPGIRRSSASPQVRVWVEPESRDDLLMFSHPRQPGNSLTSSSVFGFRSAIIVMWTSTCTADHHTCIQLNVCTVLLCTSLRAYL